MGNALPIVIDSDGRLGSAQQEGAVRGQSLFRSAEDLLFGVESQINQHIAQEHDIYRGQERPLPDQVRLSEFHPLTAEHGPSRCPPKERRPRRASHS